MHGDYSPWGELAAMPEVELLREVPRRPGAVGEYVKRGGRNRAGLIRLHPDMPRRQARSVLCHELRHHEAGDVGMTVRQEFLADTNAARLLIDIRDLADAMILHDHHRSAVAVELRVGDDVVATRLKRLHPSEYHWLRNRLADP